MQRYQQRRRGRPPWVIINVTSVLIALCICFILFLVISFGLNIGSIFANISYDIVTIIFVIAQFVLLFFQLRASNRLSASHQTPENTASQNPRGILGVIPPTDPRTIQQRRTVVEDVYAMLAQPLSRAVVLTGIVGCGKSYTAGLVREHVETLRSNNQGFFTGQSLWLTIDGETTINDLAVTLFNALHKRMPDLNNLSAQNRAAVIFSMLNEITETRLIILDQFDRLLDMQTGYVHWDRPGINELLDAILNQYCKCRFLLTSRVRLRVNQGYDLTDANEYRVKDLDDTEAKQLLRQLSANRIMQVQPYELQRITGYCNNQTLALSLLASHLKIHNLELATFLKDATHIRRWIEETASYGPDGGLSALLETQLTHLQQRMLLAFSVFRKPVPRDAVQAMLKSTKPKSQVRYLAETFFRVQEPPGSILSNCEILLRLNLLQASTEYEQHYQPHPLILAYAKYQFDRSSQEENEKLLQLAYAEAAKYYLEKASRLMGQEEPHSGVNLRLFYIAETVWHHCQSKQHQRAYVQLEHERFSLNSMNEQEKRILLDSYQQLLPTENWHPKAAERLQIYNHLGDICNALGKRQEALSFYEEVRTISRELRDYDMEQRATEMINTLNQTSADSF